MMKLRFGLILSAFTALVATAAPAQAGFLSPGFNSNTLPANDDGSTGLVNIGFGINYFGTTYNNLFVNNNGNVTFTAPLGTFTPFGLTGAGIPPIIAAFFADVDTRGAGSGLTKYGNGAFGGRNAFGVTWEDVGYFNSQTNKLNTFQLLIVDRADTGTGNFDIVLNYAKIQWETGGASGGSNGLGGSPARVGFSNGSGVPGTNFELAGSGVSGAFLDNGPAGTRLIDNRIGSQQSGQYIFGARNGQLPTAGGVTAPLPPTALLLLAALPALGLRRRFRS